MTPESVHSPAGAVLLVRTPDAERSLAAGRSYFIGRDPQSDIVVNDSRVSWRHAVLRQDGSTWLVEDVGSTNGTFQGRDRVQRVEISVSCALRLGHPDDGPVMSCSIVAPARPAEGAPAGRGAPTRYVDTPAASPAPPPNPAVNRVAGDVGYAGAAPAAGYAGAPQGAGYAGAPQGAGYAGATPAAEFAGGPPGPGYGAQRGYGDGAQGGAGLPPVGGLGGPPVQGNRPLSFEQRAPSAVLRLPTTLLRIGRAAD